MQSLSILTVLIINGSRPQMSLGYQYDSLENETCRGTLWEYFNDAPLCALEKEYHGVYVHEPRLFEESPPVGNFLRISPEAGEMAEARNRKISLLDFSISKAYEALNLIERNLRISDSPINELHYGAQREAKVCEIEHLILEREALVKLNLPLMLKLRMLRQIRFSILCAVLVFIILALLVI